MWWSTWIPASFKYFYGRGTPEGSKLVEFSIVVTETMSSDDGLNMKNIDGNHKTMAQRSLKGAFSQYFLIKIIDEDKRFCFRPYSYKPLRRCYSKAIKGLWWRDGPVLEDLLEPDPNITSHRRPKLLPTKLESEEIVAVYNPKAFFASSVSIKGQWRSTMKPPTRTPCGRGLIHFARKAYDPLKFPRDTLPSVNERWRDVVHCFRLNALSWRKACL